jgi:hypothetical protein
MPARGVGVVRGEEADGVVAPVVGQAPLGQHVVADVLVHRHELDGGDAEGLQVLDDGRVRQAQVRAALLPGQVRVQPGQAPDVGLVDHALVVGHPRRPVPGPVEERVDHHAPGDERRRVVGVAAAGPAELVGVHRRVPGHLALDRLGVRVQQQLGRVAAHPGARVVGAVHPVPVALPRPGAGQVAVPDIPVHLAQVHPGLGAVVVEQAELDPLRRLGEKREVSPEPVVGGPQRIAGSWPHGRARCRSSWQAVPSRLSSTPPPRSRPLAALLRAPARFPGDCAAAPW